MSHLSTTYWCFVLNWHLTATVSCIQLSIQHFHLNIPEATWTLHAQNWALPLPWPQPCPSQSVTVHPYQGLRLEPWTHSCHFPWPATSNWTWISSVLPPQTLSISSATMHFFCLDYCNNFELCFFLLKSIHHTEARAIFEKCKSYCLTPSSLFLILDSLVHAKKNVQAGLIILHPTSPNVNHSVTSYWPVDSVQNLPLDLQSLWDLPLSSPLTEFPHNWPCGPSTEWGSRPAQSPSFPTHSHPPDSVTTL